MGPPPPSPRIEGQQQQQQPYNRSRPPAAAAATTTAAAAPVISSYASLASAPPPSFARKTFTATAAVTNNTTTTGGSTSASAAATNGGDYHRPPSPRSGSGSYGGLGSSRGGGGSSSGGRYLTSRSYSNDGRGGGRGPVGRGSAFRGGRGGRFGSEDRGGRGGRDAGGRFDASRGRGRGRDYMYGSGSGGVGRGGRGRSSFRGGGGIGRGSSYLSGDRRGSYSGGDYNDNSYSSFDNNSVGEIQPRGNSFSEDVSVDGAGGPQGGDRFLRGSGSDGARSVSPHPPYAGNNRRPYGSFASEASGDFRRSTSQEGRPEENDSYFASVGGAKRRREESSYASIAEAGEEPSKRAKDDIQPPAASGEGAATIAAAAAASAADTPDEGEVTEDTSHKDVSSANNEPRLGDDGRWPSPANSRESPQAIRRQYSGSQFDDPPYLDSYRDSSFIGGRGRGRGRGRGGGGGYRGGRGGRGSDYRSLGSSNSQEFGGRYGSGDRSLSITAPSDRDGGIRRGPEPSPRPYAQYSDLATTPSSNWRRLEDDGPQPSPRGDWRKPPSLQPPTVRAPVVSSYATLATNPPPRAMTSSSTTTKAGLSSPSSPDKTTQMPQTQPKAPTPAPERVKTPPPSPGPPSGLTSALARLADLEAQMEFAFAKHIMLAKRHQLLVAQYDHLEGLPVGVEAFQDELSKLTGVEKVGE